MFQFLCGTLEGPDPVLHQYKSPLCLLLTERNEVVWEKSMQCPSEALLYCVVLDLREPLVSL